MIYPIARLELLVILFLRSVPEDDNAATLTRVLPSIPWFWITISPQQRNHREMLAAFATISDAGCGFDTYLSYHYTEIY
jgi:hypothetical protein